VLRLKHFDLGLLML